MCAPPYPPHKLDHAFRNHDFVYKLTELTSNVLLVLQSYLHSRGLPLKVADLSAYATQVRLETSQHGLHTLIEAEDGRRGGQLYLTSIYVTHHPRI